MKPSSIFRVLLLPVWLLALLVYWCLFVLLNKAIIKEGSIESENIISKILLLIDTFIQYGHFSNNKKLSDISNLAGESKATHRYQNKNTTKNSFEYYIFIFLTLLVFLEIAGFIQFIIELFTDYSLSLQSDLISLGIVYSVTFLPTSLLFYFLLSSSLKEIVFLEPLVKAYRTERLFSNINEADAGTEAIINRSVASIIPLIRKPKK